VSSGAPASLHGPSKVNDPRIFSFEKGKAMTTKGNYAEAVPTRDSDIAAFKYEHPMDLEAMRLLGRMPSGQFLVENHHRFEIFSFQSPDGEGVFDVRGIKAALATGKLEFQMYQMDLDLDLVEHARNNHGVEPQRVAALTTADLERPAIGVLFPDGHTVFIDGNHRMVRRWDDGLRTMRFAMVALSLELLPYMCDPGKEEKFVEREPKPGFTTLAITKIGAP